MSLRAINDYYEEKEEPKKKHLPYIGIAEGGKIDRPGLVSG